MLESGWLSSGVARQPARVPAWGWALIALLLINVLILLAVVIGAKPAMQNTDSPPAAISPSVVDTRAVDSEPPSRLRPGGPEQNRAHLRVRQRIQPRSHKTPQDNPP